jgi:hypothetical protein
VLKAPPNPLKKNPLFIKGVTTQDDNEKALLRHYKNRFGMTKMRLKGINVEELYKGFAKGVAMANTVAPDSVARIEAYVHGALPGICASKDFKDGATSLRLITSKWNNLDEKEKKEMQIKVVHQPLLLLLLLR